MTQGDFAEGGLISVADGFDSGYRAQPVLSVAGTKIRIVCLPPNCNGSPTDDIKGAGTSENGLTHFLTRVPAGIHAKTSALAPTRRAQVSAWRFGRTRDCTRGRRLLP